MIVDVHYHMIPMMPEEMIESLLHDPIRMAKVMGRETDYPSLFEKAKALWGDPKGDKLIESMDEEGVDFTVICAVDNADNEVFTTELVEWQNKTVGDIAQKYSDRVMALAGVDPRRKDAPDLLKKAFDECGMRGLKYHADYGYDPSGPESYRLLEIVQANDGVLLTHTGPLPPPSRAKYADPALLADIGVDFPDLKVIAAHMGMVNWRPWAALACHQPNLYGDLAMWDAYAFGRYDLFCRDLRDLIDFVGVEKVLFATDDPIAKVVRPTREWIALIRDLPTKAPTGIRFTEQEVLAILGGNAISLLGLG
jgi:predicted TIM-barrel fold metal-dependent hydrolase